MSRSAANSARESGVGDPALGAMRRVAGFLASQWRRGRIPSLILPALLAVLAWNSIDYVTHERVRTDSGVFAGTAMHVLAGKVLYRDVWDHKPPMIYVIDGLALMASRHPIRSIRLAERLFAVAAAVPFFWLVLVVFKRRWLAFPAALFFLLQFYCPRVLQGGNFTEEYAAIFVLAGALVATLGRRGPARRFLPLGLAAGFLFSCGAFTKEPFLLSSVPWFCYLVLRPDRPWRSRAKCAGLFVAGALVPFGCFLLYFLVHGALPAWLDVISYNMNYTARFGGAVPLALRIVDNFDAANVRVFAVTVSLRVCVLVGVAALSSRPFLRHYDFFPLAVLGFFAFDYLGTAVTLRGFGHYYLQVVASFVLMATCGAALVADVLARSKARKPLVVACLVGMVLIVDYRPLGHYCMRILTPSAALRRGPVSQYVIEHSTPSDRIWANWQRNSRYYVETDRLSPTKYLFVDTHIFIDTGRSTAGQKRALLKAQLAAHPPKFIILSGVSFLEDCGLLDWILEHYAPVPVTEPGTVEYPGRVFLYERKPGVPSE